MLSPGRRLRAPAGLGVLLVTLALAVTACGTRVDEATLQTTNGLLSGSAGPEQRAGGGSSGDAPATATDLAFPETNGAGGVIPSVGAETAEGAGGVAKPEIRIGSFGTGSGIVGAQLAGIPVAMRAWVSDVNARGGINGHRVRLLTGDDGGDPGRALVIARRMVEQDKVVAFVGTYASTTMQAVIPYLEERKVPAIGDSGGPAQDMSAMVFQAHLGNLGLHRALLTAFVSQTNARKLAFLYCRESSTCTRAHERVVAYAPKAGVEIVYEAQVSLAQPDYTAEMIGARNAGAEVVSAFIDTNSMIRIIRSAHRQGWRPQFSGGVANYEESFLSGGSDVEGVFAVSGTAPWSTSRAFADYRAAVKRYVPGGAVGGVGGVAWTAGKLFEIVAARSRGLPTSASILDALLALRRETVGGRVPPLSFPRGADRTHVNLCAVPIRVAGGRFTAPKGETFYCASDAGIRQI